MAEPRIRVNREIRIKEVRVIGPEGEQLGILATYEAIKKAVEFGLDLVEVAPTAKPPVCRIMDFGKYKYELAKKQHGARQHQRSMQLKEVKVRPYTDKHDIEIKIRNVRRFLEDRNKAKVTLTFRGREMAYRETAKGIMVQFAEGVKDVGVVEVPAKMEGNSMIMIISPRSDVQKSRGTGTESVATAEGREDVKDQTQDA